MMEGSLTARAVKKIAHDKLALASLAIIVIYCIIALGASFNLIAVNHARTAGPEYTPPCGQFLFGTDFLGRDVLQRVVHGTKIAMSVGLFTTLIAVPIGIFFGALAGYYRRRVDEIIVWFYSTLDSIPNLLLLLALTLILGKGLTAVYIALGLTSWVGICRIVRAEFIKQKEMDYVQSARALGAGNVRIMVLHILPNVFHLILINVSLLFVAAIKFEVILSYLGVGAQGEPSWGVMISDARLELLGRGVYWQLLAATLAMFIIILALNIFADALRDAFDPRVSNKK
ncbi:MAG: peptide ABC transporter permease [Candidatus Raymondbacteria bacterium RifOxyC12_full_50_8]|uniref:Peptide ABC transporter permease n=1 Tax=Candidatus Raymondbacteria bacterium RIFOXYD12_FULL_49_13 TaxID=1817890 RepID=A0A1F7FC82_UNCRA|nr:MAG: peptide ABC transporter permease [Candidatus Raymondbacteria bacterium RIFOXYA2_FULL_49_16]OGJ93283.1 MAG: peptide ABC transporter permease [Candidatus Raymondbacteria bacterium RifOxyB12_full_50_8]OGK04243.1 MAG: peptide ABC transporter permease [Candidatus Raymondbacteria bacterium RIFOXYD12_FULL_49_13]OGK06070.1 MAG: peptide ABC transporter permease [Candidatus Raymondbacteria bacterium RifOxyC12_full_50_8]OGP42474.1 MAG: peptide ABC transporter permease [Candidatus Raymondbacteria b